MEASTRVMLDRLSGSEKIGTAHKITDTGQAAFGTLFKDALNQLTETQVGADRSMQAMIMGEDVAMHEVMIQATEAQLSLELAVQVRNKCIEAFNEMKNMQF